MLDHCRLLDAGRQLDPRSYGACAHLSRGGSGVHHAPPLLIRDTVSRAADSGIRTGVEQAPGFFDALLLERVRSADIRALSPSLLHSARGLSGGMAFNLRPCNV